MIHCIFICNNLIIGLLWTWLVCLWFTKIGLQKPLVYKNCQLNSYIVFNFSVVHTWTVEEGINLCIVIDQADSSTPLSYQNKWTKSQHNASNGWRLAWHLDFFVFGPWLYLLSTKPSKSCHAGIWLQRASPTPLKLAPSAGIIVVITACTTTVGWPARNWWLFGWKFNREFFFLSQATTDTGSYVYQCWSEQNPT